MKSSIYKKTVTYTQALELLKKGEVVALPTETVYGLAGRIDSQKTLEKIFHVKNRPFFDPLIVHCYDKHQARQYVEETSPLVEKLWDAFSPGPLTLVLRKNSRILPLITAHQDTVALRIPRHPLMRRILKDLQVPVAAPAPICLAVSAPQERLMSSWLLRERFLYWMEGFVKRVWNPRLSDL